MKSDSDFHSLGSYRSSKVPGIKTAVTFVDARPASRCPVIVVGITGRRVLTCFLWHCLCFLPTGQLGRLSSLLQGRENQQRGDNIRVIFLAFESQIPGFQHKPDWEIYMDGWETLNLGLIRLFRSGSWRSWEADLMVGSLGRSPGGLPLPCSPASPRRGEM